MRGTQPYPISLSHSLLCTIHEEQHIRTLPEGGRDEGGMCAKMKTQSHPCRTLLLASRLSVFRGLFFSQGAKRPTYKHSRSLCPELHLSATESSYIHICHIYRRPRRRGAVGKTHDQASQVSYICRAYVAGWMEIEDCRCRSKGVYSTQNGLARVVGASGPGRGGSLTFCSRQSDLYI